MIMKKRQLDLVGFRKARRLNSSVAAPSVLLPYYLGLMSDSQLSLPEGPITLMFTDVESSTEMTARIGDEGWRDVVTEHHETVRTIASQHGGREIKSLGDGLMLAFISARRAIQAAIAIQQALVSATAEGEPFKVRIGLNTGEVAHDQGDMLGSAVNAASRIATRAEGGQILAAEVVKQVAGTIPGVDFRDRGRVTLKGFSERWRLYEIASTEQQERSARTSFVGREEERSQLRQLLESALAGSGGVVMLGGEPGIGKTRLAEEIADEARSRGALALIGHCYDTDSPLPYAPFVEMTNTIARIAPKNAFRQALGEDASEVARLVPEIRRMFPDIAEPVRLPPEQERQYLFNSIVNYLDRSCRFQPLVFILDDLQWADEASLLLLTQVAQRAAEMPILVIGTYRDIELEVARPLAHALEDLLRRRLAQRISLRRFSEEGVEKLLSVLAQRTAIGKSASSPPPALIKLIYRETEGNPFFVEEVFQHLNEEGRMFNEEGSWQSDVSIEDFEVPESVRLVIGRRLERLTEPTRRVLTTASLIGPAFSYQLLEELEGDDPDALVDAIDEAEAAHLISSARRGMETQISFGHELIRQTLMSSVSLPRRQRVHSRIADAMEKTYADEGRLFDHAIEIAQHLYQSGGSDQAKASRYLSFAGYMAINATAFDEARRHYEMALELHPGGDDLALAELRYQLGYAQRAIGNWDEALANWNDSLSIYELHKHQTGGRVARGVAYQLAWAGRTEEARNVALRGLSIISDGPSRERARLLAVAAMTSALLGNAEGYRMVEEAEVIANSLGHERTVLEVLSARAVIEWGYARPMECVQVATRAANSFKQRGDLFQWVGVCAFLEQSLTMMGRFQEADELALEYGPVAEKIGHLGALIPHRRATAFRAGFVTPDDMVAAAEEDREWTERIGPAWVGQSAAWKALALFYSGDWDQCVDLALGPALEENEGIYEKMNSAGLVLPLALMGRVDDALSLVADLQPPADPESHIPSGRKMLLAMAPSLFAVVGDRRRTAELYPLLSKMLEQKLFFGFFGTPPHQMSAAASAAALDDWDAADRHIQEAIDLCEKLNRRFELPIVLTVWGMVLKQWAPDQQQESRAVLMRAQEEFEKLNIKRPAEMVRAKL